MKIEEGTYSNRTKLLTRVALEGWMFFNVTVVPKVIGGVKNQQALRPE
jgi:hypothetical protein